MNTHDITAVIPVRAGSRRLKNKNIFPWEDEKNLLTYKIHQLKMVKEINRIVVSSDSDEMLAMGDANGCYTHKRSPEYCDEKTKSWGEVIAHIAQSVQGEHILWAHATCPLIEPARYSDAISTYFEILTQGYDSLVSFEAHQRYTWDKNGPVNYVLGKGHIPSQELEPTYTPTFGIGLMPRLDMIKHTYLHGPQPYRYLLSKIESVDIDDELDLVQAKAFYNYSKVGIEGYR